MDPATWIYLALMLAGTAAQQQSQRKVNKERSKAMTEESTRRAKLTKENEAAAESSKQLLASTKDREKGRAAELANQITVDQTRPTTTADGQTRLLDTLAPTSSTRTIEGAKAGFARNKSYADTRAKLMGQIGAFGSVMGDNAKGLTRNSDDIGMNATSMQNWNQHVLPARLEFANKSGREWSTAGDVMKLAAAVMAPYALGGGTAGTAGTGAVTAGDQIRNARFGAQPDFGGGSGMNFGSVMGAGGGGLVSSEAFSAAMMKQAQGLPLSAAELQLIRGLQ